MSDSLVLAPAPMVATSALRRIWPEVSDNAAARDLLFLERWEMHPLPGTAAALRVGQIRRANPVLAAEIRAEIARGRPLTIDERQGLLK